MTIAWDCGFEARADDEAGLVAEVKRHASDAHGMELSDDEARALVVRAERDPSAAAGSESREEES
jgi:predicted small metal-binding protein